MASKEFEALGAILKPGLAIPGDPVALVREKMHAIHPTAVPEGAEVERLTLGGVPCAWVSTPGAGAADRALFHVHGGAFVSTGLEHYVPYAARLSRALQARVLVHAYRLAPEHRFPAALDDTVAVYRGLLEAGLDPRRLAVSGDSCGGGIALAALVALRDAGERLPAAYVGITPWLDLECQGDSARNPRGLDPFVEPEWIRLRGRDYVGPTGDPRNPLASPVHAELAGLPPLFLSVGEVDTTRDDSTRLAARAGAAGVAVTLEIWPEMIHGFHGLADLIPEGREALSSAAAFLERQIP